MEMRISDIPMINPHNLEGVGMGQSPYKIDFDKNIQKSMDPKNSINPINQLTLLLFVLDPYYSQSHKVTMTETGNDTRVFRTKTPAVNMDDDPDNDIPYDTFEIKLNYPLPYPQIIEQIGESRERIMADSAEIEYLKKNETIVNDYDEDGEITEEERLHFPVWQGPDYTESEQNPYLISNMIFNQNDCAPLDQTEFIADDAKFRLKVQIPERYRYREEELPDTIEITLKISEDDKEHVIKAKKLHGLYQSGFVYLISSKDYSDFYQDDEGNYFYISDSGEYIRVIKHDNIGSFNYYDIKLKTSIGDAEYLNESSEAEPGLAYAAYAYYEELGTNEIQADSYTNAYNGFLNVVNVIDNELGHTVLVITLF